MVGKEQLDELHMGEDDMDRLTRILRLIRDGCSSPDADAVGLRACHYLADAALGGKQTTTVQRGWAKEFAEKYADEPTPRG